MRQMAVAQKEPSDITGQPTKTKGVTAKTVRSSSYGFRRILAASMEQPTTTAIVETTTTASTIDQLQRIRGCSEKPTTLIASTAGHTTAAKLIAPVTAKNRGEARAAISAITLGTVLAFFGEPEFDLLFGKRIDEQDDRTARGSRSVGCHPSCGR